MSDHGRLARDLNVYTITYNDVRLHGTVLTENELCGIMDAPLILFVRLHVTVLTENELCGIMDAPLILFGHTILAAVIDCGIPDALPIVGLTQAARVAGDILGNQFSTCVWT